MYIKPEELRRVSVAALEKLGVPGEHADIISDTICYAHSMNKPTHGLGRLPIYEKKIKNGLMDSSTPWNVVNDSGATADIDAANGFGQVAAYGAVGLGVEKAREYGISIVAVKNSNSFGAAGYFSKMAADNGMIAIAMSNSAPAMYCEGAGKAPLGTNPFSAAVPTGHENTPFILDFAMTGVARSKIRLALQKGEDIPLGWAVDADGQPTASPKEAMNGGLLPVGGYKGLGLAMLVDIMTGMLSGGLFAGDVKNLAHPTDRSGCSHTFIVIDPYRFMDKKEYSERAAYFIERMHESGIVLPGEHAKKCGMTSDGLVFVEDDHMSFAKGMINET